MSGSTYDWSTTASSNDSADGDIVWTEGQNAKTVNNSARAMMGRIAEYRDDQGGLVTIGGTANAITATLNSSFTTLADGRHFTLQPTSDNTGAVTLNVNGIGAKAIRKFDSTGEVALNSGDLQAGAFYDLIYDSSANSSAGAWVVKNPTAQPQNSKLTDIAALTPTDGNIIVGDGTTWVAESGSTARASIGAVGGPASATDSNFAAFDSTTGKLIKDSGKSSASFATAAQGAKADSALQSVADGSTSAKGIVELATAAEVATGTDTTRVPSVSTMGAHQGAAKAWVSFNGTGTVAINDSYNVSSITDNGTGNYTVHFTTAMADTNYAVIATAAPSTSDASPGRWASVSSKATGSFNVQTWSSSANNADCAIVDCVIFGN